MVKIRLLKSISRATPVNMDPAGAVQWTEPSKSSVLAFGKISLMNWSSGRCQPDSIVASPILGRPAINLQVTVVFRHKVADGGAGVDAVRHAAGREDGGVHGFAGSHSGDPDVRDVEAEDSADGAVGDDSHRADHAVAHATGGDRHFAHGRNPVHDHQRHRLLSTSTPSIIASTTISAVDHVAIWS